MDEVLSLQTEEIQAFLGQTSVLDRLSAWGLIGAASVLLYGLLSLFGLDPAFLAAPIAVQEMVFAVRLIVRGFDPSEIAAEAA